MFQAHLELLCFSHGISDFSWPLDPLREDCNLETIVAIYAHLYLIIARTVNHPFRFNNDTVRRCAGALHMGEGPEGFI